MSRFFRNESGFTLIEILIVIIIVGILVGLAVPQITGIRQSTWASVCTSNRSTLESVAEAYKVQNTNYPGSPTDATGVEFQSALYSANLLKALVECPATSDDKVYKINASGTVSCDNQKPAPNDKQHK